MRSMWLMMLAATLALPPAWAQARGSAPLPQLFELAGTHAGVVTPCSSPPRQRASNISATIQNWAKEWDIRFEYIQPGKPQQNAYVERFNRTVRYEWLSQYYWSSIQEVQDFATQWMWSYNHDRSNMALGGFTPKQHLAKAG